MADIKNKQVGGEDTQDPVLTYGWADANTLIEGGRLVWERVDTGYLTNSTYALANPTNVRIMGVCAEHCDNTTGNAFGNSAAAGGAVVRVQQGIFLLNPSSITQAALRQPVWLVSDVTGTNNGLPTVGLVPMSSGAPLPFVGYVHPNPVPSTTNPDGGKVPVRIAQHAGPGPIPAVLTQDYTIDPTTARSAAFTAVVGFAHAINPSGATFAYTLPAITADNDGMKIGIFNVSTGSTATVAAPTGSDNVGNCAGAATGATAAGPTGGATKVYIADNTRKAWLVGL